VTRLPLSDPDLADARRRTALLRGALAAAVGVLVGACLLVSFRLGDSSSGAATPAGSGDVAVVDVSGSISEAANRRILHTLQTIVAAAGPRGHAGLILFSDSALVALPATAPIAELGRYLRFFHVTASPPVVYGGLPISRDTGTVQPWVRSFSAGTRISAGLRAARRELRRERNPGRAVLMSDLADEEQDAESFRSELIAFDRAGLELDVVPLPTVDRGGVALVRQLLGPRHLGRLHEAAAAPLGATAKQQGPSRRLIALTAAVAVALALFELLAVPLTWGRRPEESAV
jgi:hypothetical protein